MGKGESERGHVRISEIIMEVTSPRAYCTVQKVASRTHTLYGCTCVRQFQLLGEGSVRCEGLATLPRSWNINSIVSLISDKLADVFLSRSASSLHTDHNTCPPTSTVSSSLCFGVLTRHLCLLSLDSTEGKVCKVWFD